jgi:hypothetical protein
VAYGGVEVYLCVFLTVTGMGLSLYETQTYSNSHLLLQASGPEGLYQHVVFINANWYTVTDSQSIPTGESHKTIMLWI